MFEFDRRVRAERTGDGWRVTAASGRRGLPPWEVGTFRERRSEHFVVLAPPEVPVDQLVVALEDGYATMSDLLTRGRLRRRYLVVVAAGPEQARALTVADPRRRDARGPVRRERHPARAGRPDHESGLGAARRRLAAVRGARLGRAPPGRHARAHACGADRLDVRPHAGVAHRGRRALRLRRPPGRAAGRRPRRALAPGRHRAPQRRARRRPPTTPARPPPTRSPTASATSACSSSTRRSTTRSCAERPARGSSTARCGASCGITLEELSSAL